MKYLINMLGALLVAGAVLAPISDAHAQARPTRPGAPAEATGRENAGKVSIELLVIHGHKADNKVDPALREYLTQLKALPFTGYKLLEQHPSSLGEGQETSIALPGGKRLKLQLIDKGETAAKVRVRIFTGDQSTFDTTVSIPRGRAFIVGGPSYQGGKLILPLSVEY